METLLLSATVSILVSAIVCTVLAANIFKMTDKYVMELINGVTDILREALVRRSGEDNKQE